MSANDKQKIAHIIDIPGPAKGQENKINALWAQIASIEDRHVEKAIHRMHSVTEARSKRK